MSVVNETQKIYVDLLFKEDLDILPKENVLVINHTHLKGVEIYVGKEAIFRDVLRKPKRYTVDNRVWDNTNRENPVHSVWLSNEEIIEYVNSLLESKDLMEYQYKRILKENDLMPGDIIEFTDGRRGVICKEADTPIPTNARYTPIRKDGELSNGRPRLVYNGMEYNVVGRYGE
ncbi:hypothetical protein U8V72_15350 [Priestia filamentosa]|uniref:hypothetical protein n=1 Tax=Priestia filamentosa TaxID=1402861 RepID=UPI000588FC6B